MTILLLRTMRPEDRTQLCYSLVIGPHLTTSAQGSVTLKDLKGLLVLDLSILGFSGLLVNIYC